MVARKTLGSDSIYPSLSPDDADAPQRKDVDIHPITGRLWQTRPVVRFRLVSTHPESNETMAQVTRNVIRLRRALRRFAVPVDVLGH